jgi:hypothetical protein
LYPNYFNDDSKDNKIDYFAEFIKSHTPQDLTDSNKESFAYRKGLYLSDVVEEKDVSFFNLLRCSSNLKGPTESFSKIDKSILESVNKTADQLFADHAPLNHVLAQVYYNHKIDGKDRKAKIARHSDKTKDMPPNGIIVFCSFYDGLDKKSYKINPNDKYDVMYKYISVLTTLRFVSKSDGTIINIPLYPNSAFFIDLKTNREYTHEIVPPQLSVEHLPTRLGYVIRCSNQEAKFEDGAVYIKSDGGWGPLERPTVEGVENLKKMYVMENSTSDIVKYEHVNFSLNDGDYLKPKIAS